MGKAKTAKTASKNNPMGREKARDIMFNGQKVKPVRFLSMNRNFIAVQYENGQIALDAKGDPMPWSKMGL